MARRLSAALLPLIAQILIGVQVSVIIGELLGRYLNDWIMNVTIKRNNGVFEAEFRLWYVSFRS